VATRVTDWGFGNPLSKDHTDEDKNLQTGFQYGLTTVAAVFKLPAHNFDTMTQALDRISADAYLTKDKHEIVELLGGLTDRDLSVLAYARHVDLAIRKWGSLWEPSWPCSATDKYVHHAEVLQKAILFSMCLWKASKGEYAKVFPDNPKRKKAKSSAEQEAIVYADPKYFDHFQLPTSDQPSAASTSIHATRVVQSANLANMDGLPLSIIDTKPVSRVTMNELYQKRQNFLDLFGEESDASELEPEPQSDTEAESDDDFDVSSAPSSTSRPSLVNFPHISNPDTRRNALQHVINMGLEVECLPTHLQSGSDFTPPAANPVEMGSLEALGVKSHQEELARMITSGVAGFAGTDLGDALIGTEHEPGPENGPDANNTLDAIRKLDRQADQGALKFLDGCKAIGIDPDSDGIPNAQLSTTIELKPHQIGGIGNALAWYENRRHVRAGAIADDAGTGKTRLALAFLSQLATREAARTDGEPFKPNLVLCPSQLLSNWEREYVPFRGLLIMYSFVGDSDGAKRAASLVGRISNADMSVAFKEKGIFDPTQPKTARCVVLCSYSTWAARTLYDSGALTAHDSKTRNELDVAVST